MPEYEKILPPKAREEMTDEEFDAVMERGMVQASSEEGQDADTFFDELERETLDSTYGNKKSSSRSLSDSLTGILKTENDLLQERAERLREKYLSSV